MIRIPVSKLEPGMICGAPIRHAADPGRVLLRPNAVVDSAGIVHLQKLGVREVWVRHPAFDLLDDKLHDEIPRCRERLYQALTCMFGGIAARDHASYHPIQCRTAVSHVITALIAHKDNIVWAETNFDGLEPLPAHGANVAYLALVVGAAVKEYIFAQRKFVSYGEAADLTNLGIGAMLHDLGKLGLDQQWRDVHVFDKRADTEEYRSHAERGYRVMRVWIEPTASQVLLHHHQRFDGLGFPRLRHHSNGRQGNPLCGDDIHVYSRIVAVVNAIDVLIARCRQRNEPVVAALASIQKPEFAGMFDPFILDAALRVITPYPPGAFVELSDGRQAGVTELNQSRPCQPRVGIITSLTERAGQRYDEIDLAEPDAPTIVKVSDQEVHEICYTLPDRPLAALCEIPTWLRTALNGPISETVSNSCNEPLRTWVVQAGIRRVGGSSRRPSPVKTLNVSRIGVGFISRQGLHVGEILEFAPKDTHGEMVRVRVSRCTPMVQGFQVGCVFE